MGYLKQLHTSSGRIPTSKAYRLYVNELMGSTSFSKKSLESVRGMLTERTVYLNDMVRTIAGVVSNATNYPAVVIMNGYDNLIVESIKIIPLIDLSALLLIGTAKGIVNGQFTTTEGVTEEICIDASNLLTQRFAGKTIKFMQENIQAECVSISNEIDGFKQLFNNLIDCLTNIISSQKNVVRVGETKLLNNPEYSDLEDAKKVLEVIDSDTEIGKVLCGDENSEISFSIGKENESQNLKNCSVVKANYKVGGKQIASIGVIGPERMDYCHVASALKVIVSELDKLNYLTSTQKSKK
jgi:heat-inducible transcriptional repressor